MWRLHRLQHLLQGHRWQRPPLPPPPPPRGRRAPWRRFHRQRGAICPHVSTAFSKRPSPPPPRKRPAGAAEKDVREKVRARRSPRQQTSARAPGRQTEAKPRIHIKAPSDCGRKLPAQTREPSPALTHCVSFSDSLRRLPPPAGCREREEERVHLPALL